MKAYIIHRPTAVERTGQLVVSYLLLGLVLIFVGVGLTIGLDICIEMIDVLQMMLGIERQNLLLVLSLMTILVGFLLIVAVMILIANRYQDDV
ncbi:MAG TPA: hypothetical protein VGM95_05745 [Lactobacillaceae bacterium]|jgi:hypothetical protein